jgi:dTDP-4-amino-4,6-dideoxygalactose transaminase
MNEMQALMGNLLLKYLDKIIEKGRKIDALYRDRLKTVPGIGFTPPLPSDIRYNYAYVPVEIDEVEFGMSRDAFYEGLKKYNIHTRRYFYPLVCDYACYRNVAIEDPLTVAHRVASRIINLPTYYDLELEDVEKICDIVVAIRSST